MRFHALILAVIVLGVALPCWGGASGVFNTPYSFSLQPADEPEMVDEDEVIVEERTIIVEETDVDAGPVEVAQPACSYLITSERLLPDIDWPWKGFLVGQRASSNFHEKFAEPVGNPFYFHSPFIETQAQIVYVWHDFPSNSQIGGGEANIIAVPMMFALTEQLQLMAWKDGYIDQDAGILAAGNGSADLGIGLKYAFIQDAANDFMMAGGLMWEMHNGSSGALQGGPSDANELTPFITAAKGWGRFHVIGSAAWRIPMNRNYSNHVLHADVHLDYEILPDILPGFFPLLEVHALYYANDADRMPLAVGGLDVTNLGSNDVRGSCVVWGDVGFRWKFTPNVSLGAAYGFPMVNPSTDIFNQRVTVDVKLTY